MEAGGKVQIYYEVQGGDWWLRGAEVEVADTLNDSAPACPRITSHTRAISERGGADGADSQNEEGMGGGRKGGGSG